MKSGDTFIVIRVPERAALFVREGDKAVSIRDQPDDGPLVKVTIGEFVFWWSIDDLAKA